jgi:hypothetical protein
MKKRKHAPIGLESAKSLEKAQKPEKAHNV